MQVSEGMSPTVLAVGPDHTLRAVAQLMSRRAVGAAVVMDPDGAGPGIITERDILRSLGAGEDPDAELVAAHLTSDVVYAEPDWSLEEAAAAMMRGRFRHLIVVERRDCGHSLRSRRRALLDRRRSDLSRAGKRCGGVSQTDRRSVGARCGDRAHTPPRAQSSGSSSTSRRVSLAHATTQPIVRTAPITLSSMNVVRPISSSVMPTAVSTGRTVGPGGGSPRRQAGSRGRAGS